MKDALNGQVEGLDDKVEAQWNVNDTVIPSCRTLTADKVEAQWNVNVNGSTLKWPGSEDKVEAQWNVNSFPQIFGSAPGIR